MEYQRALDAAIDGEHKLAQKILLEIINCGEGDYRTWYLLSQVTDRKSLQVAALNKANLLKPNFQDQLKGIDSPPKDPTEVSSHSKLSPTPKQDFIPISTQQETPLDELALSTRVYNALRRSGIDSIEDLLSLTTEQIHRINHIGDKCVDEIRTKLNTFRDTSINKPTAIPKTPSNSIEQNINNKINAHEALYPSLADDTQPLDILQLSPRTYNALKRAKIVTVGQLAVKSSDHLIDVNNIGMRSLSEIKKRIKSYNQALISTPTFVDQIGLSDDQFIEDLPINKILINRLGLPENIESLLDSKGVVSLKDLLFMPPGLVLGLSVDSTNKCNFDGRIQR